MEFYSGKTRKPGRFSDGLLHRCSHVVTHICDTLDRLDPKLQPRRRLIKFVQDRPGHDQRYAIDASKLEGELGWRAEENFDTGIEKTVRWYLDNPGWWQPLRDKVYAGQRLGLFDIKASG